VGVEHHLLGLARIGPHKQHPAVAEPDMGDFDGHRHAVDQHHLVAPVELVGFSRRKAQRHERGGWRRHLFAAPTTGIAADGIIAALVAETPKFLEDPDQRQPFPGGLRLVRCEDAIKSRLPRPDPGPWLALPLILEGRRAGTHNLAHRVPRHVQLPHDLPYRLALHEKLAPDPRNRVHALHPPPPVQTKGQAVCQSQTSGGQTCTPNTRRNAQNSARAVS